MNQTDDKEVATCLWTEIKSWNWDAIAAIAAAITAVLALATIVADNHDAKEGRKQQQTMFQGNVMSDCMQQYFAIRSEAASNWDPQSTNLGGRQKVQDLYSERMYGLHFKEYYLFRQDAIPTHVYTIWIHSFRSEVLRTSTNQVLPFGKYYPPLTNIDKYIALYTNDDFNIFFRKVLDSDSESNIDRLVDEEADKPHYR